MTQSFVLSTITQGIVLVLLASAPMLVTGLIVGFVIALLQTVTSIQEQTLSFVPKVLCVFLVMIITTPFLISTGVAYIEHLYGQIPNLVP